LLSFVAAVNPVNLRVNDAFSRELIRLAAVPDGLSGIWFTHWNRPAAQLDNEHRPLVLVQATALRDFIVREVTEPKAVAPMFWGRIVLGHHRC
jgi:hypothetical protein